MKNGIDLSKLRDEVESRKKEKYKISNQLGETQEMDNPKDSFLYKLTQSLKTGNENESISRIKMIENKVSQDNNEKPLYNVNKPLPKEKIQKNESISNKTNVGGQERDDLLWKEFERKKKETLADSLEKYGKPNHQKNNLSTSNNAGMLNEGYLVENVKKVVDGYLSDNYSQLLEESIKNAVIEMYAIERIKTVINENKSLIREVVIDTIRELQAKSKKKG